jgi:hypothetical protein
MISYHPDLADRPRFTLYLEDELSIEPGNVKEVDDVFDRSHA